MRQTLAMRRDQGGVGESHPNELQQVLSFVSRLSSTYNSFPGAQYCAKCRILQSS